MTSLYGVAMVRNEADILESWVRYHVQVLDGLLVADHASVDSTWEILRQLESEGLPIEPMRLDRADYDQARVMTDLARQAVSRGADWVFPVDGDEFLHFRTTDPRRWLSGRDGDSPIALTWQTYIPRHDDPSGEMNPLLRITWRLEKESRRYDKVILPRQMLMNESVSVARGSHALLEGDNPLPSATGPSDWAMAHFPVRSVEQLARKVFVGWIASLAQPERTPRTSYQWRKWFHYLIDHDMAGLDAGQLAMTYLNEEAGIEADVSLVYDPLPREICDFELRYSVPESVSPLKALALAAESQAVDLAELRRQLR